jgi:hypothetical protein
MPENAKPMELRDCPSFFDHTPCPEGYIEWHDWAKKMGRTHKQIRCTRCNLFAIWIPKPKIN